MCCNCRRRNQTYLWCWGFSENGFSDSNPATSVCQPETLMNMNRASGRISTKPSLFVTTGSGGRLEGEKLTICNLV